jgi:hypothetical protein
MIRALTSAAILSLTLVAGSALAQTPPPPAGAPAPSATDKQAISKTCSDLANQRNLHGKERRKFRRACRRNGGQPPS